MENKENFRRWLIYIIRSYEEYYDTYMKEEFDQCSEEVHSLEAVKNNQIREYGYFNEELANEIKESFDYISVLYRERSTRKTFTFGINDDDTLEIISEKLRKFCEEEYNVVDTKFDVVIDDEPVYINELRIAREAGLEEESKFLKEKRLEILARGKNSYAMHGIHSNEQLFSKNTLIHKLREAKKNGLKEERKIMELQKKIKIQQDRLEQEGFEIGYDTLTHNALLYQLKDARNKGFKEELRFIRQK